MYITYETNQWNIIDSYGKVHRPIQSHYGRFSIEQTRSFVTDFRPAYLVRVSDMHLVQGTDVIEGYCTLSYSWKWSGDIIPQESRYIRVDNGKHKIVSYKLGKSHWWRRSKIDPSTRQTRWVKFEGIIQQICQDFNIRYIWYDQMCINQGDPLEKRREIQKMHKIYKHAYCTVALIPELEFNGSARFGPNCARIDAIMNSEWSKRIWTLEEAYMSRRLLFVGRNVHMWSETVAEDITALSTQLLYNLCIKSCKWNTSTALCYAHTRTSTKPHDKIFALANIFSDIVDGITYDYEQDLLNLMIQFYGLLAKQDPSMLCFGAPNDQTFIRPKEDLPSWTGINGTHIPQVSVVSQATSYSIQERRMLIETDCIPVSIRKTYRMGGAPRWLPGVSGNRCLRRSPTRLSLQFVPIEESNCFNWFTAWYGIKPTHWLPVKAKDDIWVNMLSPSAWAGGFLSLTEKFSQCFILSSICFNTQHSNFKAMPVVKKNGINYRSIGLCFLFNSASPIIDIEIRQQKIIIE